MKTIELSVYPFEELNEEAQQTAIDNCRSNEFYLDYDWYPEEDIHEIAKILGIEIDKIYWTGFSSQGDGACFVGSYSYAKNSVKLIKEYAPLETELHKLAQSLYNIQKKYFFGLSANVEHSGHYYHSGCTNIEVYNYERDYANDEAEDEVKQLLREFMDYIYKRYEQDYDYLNTDEAIEEHFEANSFEFYADGSSY